jgi:hypothetical protein
MSELVIGYSDYVEHHQATLLTLISNQSRLLDIQAAHIITLNRRVADLIKEQIELRERIEAQKEAVPYALTPKQAKSCKTCRHLNTGQDCHECDAALNRWQAADYRIPKAGCRCGACEAARGRGEMDHGE